MDRRTRWGGLSAPVRHVPVLTTAGDRPEAGSATRPVTGRWWVLLLLISGFVVAGIVVAPLAGAHATVESSDPADGARLAKAPSEVTITFDEQVGLDLGYLEVIDRTGTSVGAGQPTHPNGRGQTIGLQLQPNLGDGTYIASWRVISADSHPVEGSIRFVVGNGVLSTAPVATAPVVATSTSVAFDIARTLGYASLVLLGGGWLLLTIWPAGRSSRRAARVLVCGWVLALVSAATELLLQGAYAAGVGLPGVLQLRLLADTVDTRYGQLHLLRLLLLAVVGVLLDLLLSGSASRPGSRRSVPGALVFLAVVFTYSDSGHAAVARPGWLALSSDMAHLMAMSAWVGGLVMLWVAVLPGRNAGQLRQVLPVFSRTASICVLVIAATGIYQGWRESGTIAALTTTTYGRLLLLKATLFAGLLMLGNLSRLAIQRRYVRPPPTVASSTATKARGRSPDVEPIAGPAQTLLVTRDVAADQDSADDGGAPTGIGVDFGRMRRSVLAELVIAAVVLSASGVLVAQAPGRTAVVSAPVVEASASTALTAGRSVTVTVRPARAGDVRVDVVLHGGTAAEQVTVTASLPAQQLGPLPVPLRSSGVLAFEADHVLLPAAGRWTFSVVVQSSELDSVVARVQIQIG